MNLSLSSYEPLFIIFIKWLVQIGHYSFSKLTWMRWHTLATAGFLTKKIFSFPFQKKRIQAKWRFYQSQVTCAPQNRQSQLLGLPLLILSYHEFPLHILHIALIYHHMICTMRIWTMLPPDFNIALPFHKI